MLAGIERFRQRLTGGEDQARLRGRFLQEAALLEEIIDIRGRGRHVALLVGQYRFQVVDHDHRPFLAKGPLHRLEGLFQVRELDDGPRICREQLPAQVVEDPAQV